MLTIDGSFGEGGGQILRTCLTLSLITGKPFHLTNIRAGRSRPGLRPQHLIAIKISAEIGKAELKGARKNGTTLTFQPRIVHPGTYQCDIGTAGSTALVLQTIYLPLSLSNQSSSVKISGGTHVNWSPSYEYIHQHWLNYLKTMGFKMSVNLDTAGFYPRGGGSITAKIHPIESISPINLHQRGKLKQIHGISAVANLDRSIAERQRAQIIRRFGNKYPLNDIRIKNLPARFKGTTICLICEFEYSQCCYFSLGSRGKPAEKVADEVANQIDHFISTDAVIDEYLADQILLPLAFAKSKSSFTTVKITDHIVTNAEIIQEFLPVPIQITGDIGSPGMVTVEPNRPL